MVDKQVSFPEKCRRIAMLVCCLLFMQWLITSLFYHQLVLVSTVSETSGASDHKQSKSQVNFRWSRKFQSWDFQCSSIYTCQPFSRIKDFLSLNPDLKLTVILHFVRVKVMIMGSILYLTHYIQTAFAQCAGFLTLLLYVFHLQNTVSILVYRFVHCMHCSRSKPCSFHHILHEAISYDEKLFSSHKPTK